MELVHLGLPISLVIMDTLEPKSVAGKNQSKPCGFPIGYDYKRSQNYYSPEGGKSAEFIIPYKTHSLILLSTARMHYFLGYLVAIEVKKMLYSSHFHYPGFRETECQD